ncbi:DUF3618 domain-containing protein [Subtercola lobariae]|uniref:DUF3618 domain-containing protein n=1 Tax=Subtercola lobariae TaxID=1588641 RepID=A0A917EZY0_9MICO|nr:DUF3618 domain-containing protein [Subtercola lobariae]GGF36543.1 hypothetical protein GCM10011399_31820 [Subtercola lobariae]
MSDHSDAPQGAPLGAASKAAAAGLKKNQPPTPEKPADTRTREQIKLDVVKNRQDLSDTLDAIEFKLNIPKQARFAAKRASDKFEELRRENPAVLVAGAAAVAAVFGGAVWLTVRVVRR